MDDKAKRNLPGFREWVRRLLTLSKEMIANVQYSEEDNFSFMTLCFLSKQIDHLQSIDKLIPSRDAILVARTMIEGMCQLLWAAEDPGTRSLQWRAFAWIYDWRLMQERIAQGEMIDPKQRAAIEDALQKYGDQYLTKRAKKAHKHHAPLPVDPYYYNWRCGTSISEICKSVGAEDLYQKLYLPFSDWQHWGVGGLGKTINRQGNQVAYSSLSSTDSATALASGFQCLFHTAQVADSHLEIGFGSRISQVRDGYVAWHERLGA